MGPKILAKTKMKLVKSKNKTKTIQINDETPQETSNEVTQCIL